MEEIKKQAREMFDNKFNKLKYYEGTMKINYHNMIIGKIKNFMDTIIDLAVSKERERRDAQIIEFINSGEPAPWNDTGWSVELSDVEKFIKNTK